MKKSFWISTLFILAVFVIFFMVDNENHFSKRDQYEEFLNQEYQKIPQISEEELDSLPKPTRPDLAAIQNYFMTLDPGLKGFQQKGFKSLLTKLNQLTDKKAQIHLLMKLYGMRFLPIWQVVPGHS